MPDAIPPGVDLGDLGIQDWFHYGWPLGGDFLVSEKAQGNPRPNLNAYLAKWRQEFGPQNMSQADAQAVYALQFTVLEELQIIDSDFDDYADVAEADAMLVVAVEAVGGDFADLPTPT